MAAVVISIFLMGSSVIGIYLFLEDYLLNLNRKMWKEWETRNQKDNQKSA